MNGRVVLVMAMILVAEEQADLREHLRLELHDRGYQVVTAADGPEALAALGKYELDLVLADARLPGFDGAQLRAWKELAPETEVIVASVKDEIAGAMDCMKSGASDYVEKPYAIPVLVTALERAVERRQLRAASTLYETSRFMLTAREPARLLQVIVEVALKALNADDVALLVPGDDGKLHTACSTALSDGIRLEVHSSLGELSQQLSVTLREPEIAQRGSVGAAILFPLWTGDRLVGLLRISRLSRLINSRTFTKSDLDKTAVLASQALLALENMRLMRYAISTERLATVGQVATSIAHEVNNPIAYVLASQTHVREQLDQALALCERLEGGTEIVELRARLDEMRQVIDDVRDGAERVRDILRDTRALAQNDDIATPVDINEPIRSALRVVAAELRHRTTVTTNLTDGLFVLGRTGRLSQLVVTLLVHVAERFGEVSSNAIVLSSKLDGERVIVTLHDNGPGIPTEQLPRLFDPFFTTNLAIARDIVRNHAGEISVESTTGGTTYTIVLPLVTAPHARQRTDSPVAGTGARLRILMIDDEPNILKSYKRALGTAHDLVLAKHGEDALAAIRAHSDFDLVLCDLSMPTMSGMQLFERVREIAPALGPRFVFATGGATQKSVEQFLASIPNLVLEKPFEMRVLRDLVADLVRTS